MICLWLVSKPFRFHAMNQYRLRLRSYLLFPVVVVVFVDYDNFFVRFMDDVFPCNGCHPSNRPMDCEPLVIGSRSSSCFVNPRLKELLLYALHVSGPVAFTCGIVIAQGFGTVLLQCFLIDTGVKSGAVIWVSVIPIWPVNAEIFIHCDKGRKRK